MISPSVCLNKTQYAYNKSEISSKAKTAFEKKLISSRKNGPLYQKQKAACHSLFFMDTCLKSQNDILVSQQNLVSDSYASSPSVSTGHNENNVLESHPLAVQEYRSPSILNEANCTANSDPDVEDVNQVSTASDQSTLSEYFSVFEDITTQLETEHM